MNYQFTEEEINKILLSSPMVLPNNPSEHGLKGESIKSYFYSFIRKLMLLLNEHFVLIERGQAETILNHDTGDLSHEDIREIIRSLMSRDNELGNLIANHYSEINLAHDDIKEKIASDISSHNIDEYAHKSLRFDLASVKQTAENALNFAQGKSKIYPVKDVYEMTTKLNDTLNIGDKFVLLDKNVPDFTLFEKNTDKSGTEFTQVDILMGTVEFVPGESYIYNGYLLVASESGVDTTQLVKRDEYELLSVIVGELDLDIENGIKSLEEKLKAKENVYSVVSESSNNVLLSTKTEHNLGLRTSVNLTLADTIESDFECIVNFRVGAYDTVFNADSRIIFTQDDCYGGVFTPCKNRIYEINIKNVDGILIARVGACDYVQI